MPDLKIPVSTTIKYADGSETIINYNPLGEKVGEPVLKPAKKKAPKKDEKINN